MLHVVYRALPLLKEIGKEYDQDDLGKFGRLQAGRSQMQPAVSVVAAIGK